MGTWIAGPFCLSSAEMMAQKGYRLQSITPGIEKEITFSLLKELAPLYDVIVLSGYPPFIKDLLDGGAQQGINWRKHQIRFLFAAEGFSEEWRRHIHSLVGRNDDLHTSINKYGSADAAILAHETPLSVAIRQQANDNDHLTTLFGTNRTPTLAQFDPRLKYFEQSEGLLIFTANAGLPLIRYSIGDEGGVASFSDMMERAKRIGFDPAKKLHKSEIWQLPFVHVFGRSDFTVSLYGLLVYPEHIKHGLERKKDLMHKITGKFVLSIEHSDKYDPYLLVRTELAAGVKPSISLKQLVHKSILDGLLEVNSEYFRLRKEMGKSVEPVIELIEQGNQEYFRQGAKQRWVRRS
jgi:phenylacetate-CoA ligase